MFKSNPYAAKTDIVGRLVVVLDGRLEGRNLQLITPISRAVCRHEVHELILTNEEAIPGHRVNRIAYLGFTEIQEGGVLVVGDELLVQGEKVGVIAGFDETHMPNHLNIVIRSRERTSGLERGVTLGSEVRCVQAHNEG
ncbi:hypothetical protein SY88_03875 [Clostridiales bacterium PH28_bin88]|nr:hypothetical protein SY88_03875 [Clostridiales bacterium PH28_bin88]